MTSVPILIGGAAGATGSVATKLLLQMGFPVRAIVRGDDGRTQSLRALPKSLSLIFSICALSGAPSNDRARSAGRRGDHLGLGVRLRRPAMPRPWRRSGHPADGDWTLLAATALHLRLPGGHPERRSAPCDRTTPGERRTPRRLPRRVRGARGGSAFRGLPARPKGLEPAQTNRHPTPNRPNFSRRFWSQVHVTPAYQKALDWRPERSLV